MAQSTLDDGGKWKKLKIELHLAAREFVDNKIYGTVKVHPETSRALIKKFELRIGDLIKTTFSAEFRTVSVSGFDPYKQRCWSATLVAIPIYESYKSEVACKTKPFSFLDYVFALSPVITFEKSTEDHQEDDKAVMVIDWNHIGDKKAQAYIINLDDKAIKHIHEQRIDDHLRIRLTNLDQKATHTLEIIAVLANGKETCRSDLITFTVPQIDSSFNGPTSPVITVLDESMPLDLPSSRVNQSTEISESDREHSPPAEPKRSLHPKSELLPEPKPNPSELRAKELLLALDRQIRDAVPRSSASFHPHQTFPGVPHYFDDDIDTIEQTRSPSPTPETEVKHMFLHRKS